MGGMAGKKTSRIRLLRASRGFDANVLHDRTFALHSRSQLYESSVSHGMALYRFVCCRGMARLSRRDAYFATKQQPYMLSLVAACFLETRGFSRHPRLHGGACGAR